MLLFMNCSQWIGGLVSHQMEQFRIQVVPDVFQVGWEIIALISFLVTSILDNCIYEPGPFSPMCFLSFFCRIDNELECSIFSHAPACTLTNSFGSFFWVENKVFNSDNQTRERNLKVLSVIVIPKMQNGCVPSPKMSVANYGLEIWFRKIRASRLGMIPMRCVVEVTHGDQPCHWKRIRNKRKLDRGERQLSVQIV